MPILVSFPGVLRRRVHHANISFAGVPHGARAGKNPRRCSVLHNGPGCTMEHTPNSATTLPSDSAKERRHWQTGGMHAAEQLALGCRTERLTMSTPCSHCNQS